MNTNHPVFPFLIFAVVVGLAAGVAVTQAVNSLGSTGLNIDQGTLTIVNPAILQTAGGAALNTSGGASTTVGGTLTVTGATSLNSGLTVSGIASSYTYTPSGNTLYSAPTTRFFSDTRPLWTAIKTFAVPGPGTFRVSFEAYVASISTCDYNIALYCSGTDNSNSRKCSNDFQVSVFTAGWRSASLDSNIQLAQGDKIFVGSGGNQGGCQPQIRNVNLQGTAGTPATGVIQD